MKISSRKEVGCRSPFPKYKEHEQTTAVNKMDDYGIRLVCHYTPTENCPPESIPVYYLAFGMDGRRFVFELSYVEAHSLRNELDKALKKSQLRQIK